jgi:hypothetical protein
MRGAALVLLLVAGAPAHADSLVRAITRHDEGDVAHLRSRLPDPNARCALGVVYIFRDDLTRAAVHLEGCAAARLEPGVAGWVKLAVKRLDERLRMSELSAVEVTTEPAGLMVAIDTVPDELFATPAMIWLPAGRHELRVDASSSVVTVGARGTAAAHLVVDLTEDTAMIDARVAAMRANDCVLYRQRHRHRLTTCDLPPLRDDLDHVPLRWRPRLAGPDSIALILRSAEEL